MVVCLCRGVTEREIRQHIRRGATCRKAVARACGAGSDCGQCAVMVAGLLAEATTQPGLGTLTLVAQGQGA